MVDNRFLKEYTGIQHEPKMGFGTLPSKNKFRNDLFYKNNISKMFTTFPLKQNEHTRTWFDKNL